MYLRKGKKMLQDDNCSLREEENMRNSIPHTPAPLKARKQRTSGAKLSPERREGKEEGVGRSIFKI